MKKTHLQEAIEGVRRDVSKLRLSDAFLKKAAEEWPKVYGAGSVPVCDRSQTEGEAMIAEHLAAILRPAVTAYGRDLTTEARGGDIYAVHPDGSFVCIWTPEEGESNAWKFKFRARLVELDDR